MIARFIAYMVDVRNRNVMQGLQSISPGVDIAYEAGRRIGVREGMDTIIKAAVDYNDDQDGRDKDL